MSVCAKITTLDHFHWRRAYNFVFSFNRFIGAISSKNRGMKKIQMVDLKGQYEGIKEEVNSSQVYPLVYEYLEFNGYGKTLAMRIFVFYGS